MFEDQRDVLNALFRTRTNQGTKIDSQLFSYHIRSRIVPCLQAIGAVLPERSRLATLELFDVSLDLFAAGHFGPESKTPLLSKLWTDLLPQLGMHLARDPRRVAGSLSNALIKIDQQSGQAAERWMIQLLRANVYAESVDELLATGKVAAWVSGLSHFRSSALDTMDLLTAALVETLLELPHNSNEAEIFNYVAELKNDPWFAGRAAGLADSMQVQQVGLCGAFLGFGGELMTPPIVSLNSGALVASDGQHVWQIFADRFGSVMQRLEMSSFSRKQSKHQGDPNVTPDGCIHWGPLRLNCPDLVDASSSAFDGRTFAVTIPTSFHVYLFAQSSVTGKSAATGAGA